MNESTRSPSRCSNPAGAPYTWYFYVDKTHHSVQKLDSWLDSLTLFARVHELGRIDNLFRLAAEGKLRDSRGATTPIKPIHSDPELYELRHRALNKQLRFYHGEPPHRLAYLVALHRHIKDVAGQQQQEIEFAISRYRNVLR